MKVWVISSSPNKDGLTAACAAAAAKGVRLAGGQAEEVRLNGLKIGHCQACETGYGVCRTDHVCDMEDDFQALHKRIPEFGGFVLVTPVYWWEMSESMKAFCDRLRRCEATAGPDSRLRERPIVAVAAAGGSGNGTITCLLSMENWIKQVGGKPFDLIAVNRWSRPYKLVTIQEAAHAMAGQKRE